MMTSNLANKENNLLDHDVPNNYPFRFYSLVTVFDGFLEAVPNQKPKVVTITEFRFGRGN